MWIMIFGNKEWTKKRNLWTQKNFIMPLLHLSLKNLSIFIIHLGELVPNKEPEDLDQTINFRQFLIILYIHSSINNRKINRQRFSHKEIINPLNYCLLDYSKISNSIQRISHCPQIVQNPLMAESNGMVGSEIIDLQKWIKVLILMNYHK